MKYLKLYSVFTNQTLTELDRPARTIEEEVEYIKTYLELEQLRYGERLQYVVRVSEDVDEKSMIPNMLLHTYCQNPIKHGIANKADGGLIEIDIRKHAENSDFIEVSVKDNGVGREEASRLNHDTTKQ